MRDRLCDVSGRQSDSQGNLAGAVDPAGNQTTFTYDPTSGTITSVTGPMGNTVQFQRDTRGNVTGVVDGAGVRTAIANDALGQPIRVTDPHEQHDDVLVRCRRQPNDGYRSP